MATAMSLVSFDFKSVGVIKALSCGMSRFSAGFWAVAFMDLSLGIRF